MTCTIKKYSADWPSQYNHIVEGLAPLLQNIPNIDFTHIGSTAVPTLSSRSVIDILITIPPTDINKTQHFLTSAGYKPILHLSPTLSVVLDFPATHAHAHAHTVYLCPRSSLATRAHLALRDLLTSDPDLRDEYNALKQSYTASLPTPSLPYATAKSHFLQQSLILSPRISASDLPLLFASSSSSSSSSLSSSQPHPPSCPNLHPHRWTPIHTPRLELREYGLVDVDGLYDLERSPANARFQSWELWTRNEARRNLVKGVWGQFGGKREVVELAVVMAGEGKMVGRVGGRVVGGCGGAVQRGEEEGEGVKLEKQSGTSDLVIEENGEEEVAAAPIHVDLWFSFLPSVQGAGLATKAMRAFLSALTEREKRARGSGKVELELEIECDPRNTASWRLAQRLGFEQHSLTERAWECKGEWVGSMVWRRTV